MYVSLFGGPCGDQAAGGPSVGAPPVMGPPFGPPPQNSGIVEGPFKPPALPDNRGAAQLSKGLSVNPLVSPFGAAPPMGAMSNMQQQREQQPLQQQPVWSAPVTPPPRLSFLQ
ncbi:hypothetical protein Esti_004421 [Eimeria stiedai]